MQTCACSVPLLLTLESFPAPCLEVYSLKHSPAWCLIFTTSSLSHPVMRAVCAQLFPCPCSLMSEGWLEIRHIGDIWTMKMEKHYKIRLPPQQVQLQSIYRCLTIWALNCRHLEFLSIVDREWDRDVPALVRDAARSTLSSTQWPSDGRVSPSAIAQTESWLAVVQSAAALGLRFPLKSLSQWLRISALLPHHSPSASPKDVLQPQLDCSLWEQLIQASLHLLSVTFVTKIWGTGI